MSPITLRLETMEASRERVERAVKEEIAYNRRESAEQARGLREEVQFSLKNSTDILAQSVDRISAAQQQRLEDFANRLNALTQANDTNASRFRLEITNTLDILNATQQDEPGRRVANTRRTVRHAQRFQRRASKADDRHGKPAEASFQALLRRDLC
jgi:DNA recombination protein RmuC